MDKRVIVAGSTYGIGAVIVEALCRAGATVASMGRSVELGAKAAQELTAEGPGVVRFYACDVASRSSVRSAFASAVEDMRGLDALVHVAGVQTIGRPEEFTDDDWDWMFSINARGVFITNQEAFTYLRDNGGGRIINFGSGAGIAGAGNNAAYAATKGAVSAWTRSAAQAWGQHDITVNQVAPAVWTPMYHDYRAQLSPEALLAHDTQMTARLPLGGKLGDPVRDLAPVVLFLVSDGSRFLTGQTFAVDGGLLMVR